MTPIYRYRKVFMLMIFITGCVIFFSHRYLGSSSLVTANFWIHVNSFNTVTQSLKFTQSAKSPEIGYSSVHQNYHGLTSQHQHKTTFSSMISNLSVNENSTKSIQSAENQKMISSVNYDEWLCGPFVGYLVDDLRIHHHQWPNHPTNRRTASSVHVYHERIQHMGAKVYGYILPPITGSYQFRILRRSNETAESGELWISTDSNPMNMIKQTVFTYSIEDVESKSHNNQSKAVSVGLNDDQNYYFEFHVKGHKGRIDTLVEWKLPKYDEFQSIPSSYLTLAFNISESNSNPFLSNNLPSNRLQSIGFTKHITYNVTKITDLNILPKCEHVKVPFSSTMPESSMYPPDPNKPTEGPLATKYYANNKELPKNRVDIISQLYKKEFDKQKRYKGKVLGVHYVEETHYKANEGSFFLLEMDVELENGTVHTSEYVYLPKDGSELCHIINFQWDRNVHVTLIVAIKKVGQWVDHLIYSLEDIYHETKDENFELVIVDFNSTDIDTEGALKKSSLPKWKYISLSGSKFHKTLALQTGTDYVKDKNSIVMTIDMHLNLPPNFIESARKHTIQGKMAYAPTVMRLYEGHSPNNPAGFRATFGYGLFSLYKSDWIAIGGWNTVKFKYKWGHEDVDVHRRTRAHKYGVHRCRPPGLFHYFHFKDGMWDNNSTNKFNC